MGAAPILTILRNGETVKSVPIEGESVLGRGDGCVIRLEDRAISRQHAVFKPTADGVQVEKKSEFGPILVNGAEATRAVLKEGDVISIGPYLMKLSIPRESPAQQQPQAPKAPPAPAAAQPRAEEASASAPSLEPLSDGGAQQADAAGGDGALPGLDAGVEMPGGELPGLDGADSAPIEGAGGQPSGEGAAPEIAEPDAPEMEAVDEDAKTKLTPMAKLSVKLIFAEGAANVTEYELTKDEISIGRGKNCDIVLNDKKASRKNAIIRRAGLSFVIKDLDSANGTYVNGVRVQEQELSGEDVVRIGGVEFQFKALSADYSKHDFMAVPEEPVEEAPADAMLPVDPGMQQSMPMDPAALGGIAQPGMDPNAIPGAMPGADLNGVAGIAGIGPNAGKKPSLMQKFRALPKQKQAMVAIGILALVYWLTEDDPSPAKKKVAKKAGVTATSGPQVKAAPTYESLTEEQKRFVEAQHTLAFDLFKNKEYDKALFEIRKIFELIPDYKNAREIERYSVEGQRKLEALQEEKRKKEEEEARKAKVAQLVEDCKDKMAKKQYDQAKDLFTQIEILDPDNVSVAGWKKDIADEEERKRLEEQQKNVQEEINKRAWDVYAEGMQLKKQGHYHAAIDTFGKVADIGASDKRVTVSSLAQIKKCKAAIRNARDPVLKEAKASEDSGDFTKAFMLYKKATVIDPPHPDGYKGMARIRGILHDRAKNLYVEAILAESYSDFETAKKKFKECMDASPADDSYHQSAERKLSHYLRKGDQQQ